MTRRTVAAVLLAALLLLPLGCVSTGDPDHPVRPWSLHEVAFGHEKYTPQEAAFARCRYRNRLPSGERSGFSRECRLEAADRFGMGINAALFATACVIDKCHAAARDEAIRQGWPLDLPYYVSQDATDPEVSP